MNLFKSIYPHLQSKITSLALQGDTCTENSIDVMHIIAIANGKTDEEIRAKYKRGETLSILNLTNDQLKLIEADLKSNHSSEKVEKAMEILRGFGSSGVSKSTGVSHETRKQHKNLKFICRICMIFILEYIFIRFICWSLRQKLWKMDVHLQIFRSLDKKNYFEKVHLSFFMKRKKKPNK